MAECRLIPSTVETSLRYVSKPIYNIQRGDKLLSINLKGVAIRFCEMLIHQDHYLGFLKDLFAALCRLFSEGKGFLWCLPFSPNWQLTWSRHKTCAMQCTYVWASPLFKKVYVYRLCLYPNPPLLFLASKHIMHWGKTMIKNEKQTGLKIVK